MIAALVVVLVLVVYYPCIFAPFNSIDDYKMANSLLNSGNVDLKAVFLPHGRAQYYRPLLSLTFLFDKFAWGISDSFMHLENVLLHLCNSLLVFRITRHLFRKEGAESRFLPPVAALLFAFHPVNTEAVNWISARSDVLSGFFVLFSLYFFVLAREQRTTGYVLVSSVFLFCGCLAKETALFVAPALLFWLFYGKCFRQSLTVWQRLLLSGPIMAAAGGYLLLRNAALSAGDKALTTIATTSQGVEQHLYLKALALILKTAGFYLKKLFIPVPLNFGIVTISPLYLWLGIVAVALVCYQLYRRKTHSFFFVAAASLTVSALMVPFLSITWTPYAERYVYIASAPFVIGMVVMAGSSQLKGRLLPRVALFPVLLIAVCAGLTFQRNLVWQDNLTLYQDTVRKSPDFGAAWNELALALQMRGRMAEADKIVSSVKVSEFQPSSLNRIRLLVSHGKLDEARLLLQERLSRPSDYERTIWELLIYVDEKRRAKEGTESVRREINLEILAAMQKLLSLTGDPFYYYRIGKVQIMLGDRTAAAASFEKAWELSSPGAHYHDAAEKLARKMK
jgi:tetratricopeptide (TPR) repeat protein